MRSPYSPMTTVDCDHHEPENVMSIMLEHYERCSFCSSKLVFSHDLNLSFLQVIETGQCPGCGVSRNPKKFTLH